MAHIYEQTMVSMRDGVQLEAIVFRPAEGVAPTLLVRTPYGIKDTPVAGSGGITPNLLSFVNAGYAVVWVECRGTFGSDGDLVPKIGEANDGFDTVDWIISQPWSNERVGTYGASYAGMTQWAIATTGHPALKAMVPTMTAMEFYEGVWYGPGGAMSPAITTTWAVVMNLQSERRALQRGESDGRALRALAEGVVSGLELMEHAPVTSHPLVPSEAWFDDFIRHPSFDSFWESQDFTRSVDKMSAPALFIAGWYDIFLSQQLRDFARLRTGGGSVEAREGTRLIVGPWDHFDAAMSARFPDRDFGLAANGSLADITGEHLRHFDRWLSDDPVEQPAPPSRVKIFVMGIDQWREECDWPLPDTEYTAYFLNDGRLSANPPRSDDRQTYAYDPRDPARTTCAVRMGSAYEPTDQAPKKDRKDVVSFETTVLDQPVEATGHVTAILSVSSDARDTDFTAKLIDVFPDGRAINLCDGIVRMRYRNGLTSPEPLEPGHVYEVEIDMSVTSNVFLPGHKIRVDISSSNFPRFDRNTNTGNDISLESIEGAVVASNTVFTGPSHLSRLVLPIINRLPANRVQAAS